MQKDIAGWLLCSQTEALQMHYVLRTAQIQPSISSTSTQHYTRSPHPKAAVPMLSQKKARDPPPGLLPNQMPPLNRTQVRIHLLSRRQEGIKGSLARCLWYPTQLSIGNAGGQGDSPTAGQNRTSQDGTKEEGAAFTAADEAAHADTDGRTAHLASLAEQADIRQVLWKLQ